MPDKKKTWTSGPNVSALLDPLRFEMANGMADDEVARRTKLSIRTIQRWRLKEGLHRPKGNASRQAETVQAVSSFGEILGDVKQRTAHSPVLGTWEPPAFVVREHLNYDQFLRVLDAAYRIGGMTETEIAKGLGLTPRSVEQGLQIYRRHRASSGRTCKNCGCDMDPNVKDYCTLLCEKTHAR